MELVKNFKNIIFLAIVVLFVLQMIVMKKEGSINQEKESAKKPLIGLSTFSLYSITKSIAKDTMDIYMILPFGVDAHSFEPTPKLMAKISKSDLVIYSGAGLEPWTHGFDFKNRVINMSKYVYLRELKAGEHHHHHHDDANKKHNEHYEIHSDAKKSHTNIDPHYWLDISNMIKATNVITAQLIKIAPQNTKIYNKNRDALKASLNKLDADFRDRLSECKIDTIVVNHNAYSYLADKYGFKVEALGGLSPEAEPSAKKMIELIEHVKEHNVSTIFFESFVSDKAIKSIAKEAKVGVEVFQPLGNITADEAKQNLSFEDIMRQNLEKLAKAMKCQ